ncbi:A24 family peptidase [Microbacterium sp. KSW-18]|uniref:A24 family peptidase n=1 Tax=Microbacterium aquilitoris TaxID=3067307 RepID=A0ABU3GME2_9MICO|nr:A24 family peptidase [Microbacterium sp. KSW-18]MDT3331654.1 A24 family peptidase [Microbacterium sp. KSW-18]
MFAGTTDPLAVTLIALAYLWVAVASVALTVIDVRTHRLPNAWVLPGYPIVGGLMLLACFAGAPWASLLRAAIGGAALFVFYLLLRAAGGGMGGGDVKLAGVLGIALGWVGWSALAVGAVAGFVFGGLYGMLLLATRRAGRRTAVAFGPWMLLGAWAGIVWGASLVDRLGL